MKTTIQVVVDDVNYPIVLFQLHMTQRFYYEFQLIISLFC